VEQRFRHYGEPIVETRVCQYENTWNEIFDRPASEMDNVWLLAADRARFKHGLLVVGIGGGRIWVGGAVEEKVFLASNRAGAEEDRF